MEFTDILTHYVTPILAAVGVLRPELTKACNAIFKKGDIDIQRGPEVTLGYSSNGPWLSITGSMIAKQRTCILTSAKVVVERFSDKAKREMDWSFFGNTQISGPTSSILELPRIVKLSQDEVFVYNIGFEDSLLREELVASASELNQKLRNLVMDTRRRILESSADSVGLDGNSALQVAYSQVSPDFRKSKECRCVLELFERNMFWHPGNYSITLKGSTDSKTQTISKTWFFDIDERDHELLKFNLARVYQQILDEQISAEAYVSRRLLKDRALPIKV